LTDEPTARPEWTFRRLARRELLRGGRSAIAASALVVATSGLAKTQSDRPAPWVAAPELQTVAELLRFAPDTYLFRYEDYVSLFVVTDEGVILVDPNGGINPLGRGNPHAPSVLKEAIHSVTDQPVRYVIYSHAAPDHATGGVAFADTARFVGHSTTATFLSNRADPATPSPEVTFTSRMTIELGGKAVELYHADLALSGPARSYIIVHHSAARMVMFTDLARIETLPFGPFVHGHPDRTLDALEWIDEHLEFDFVVWGHASPRVIGTRNDLRSTRRYIFDLSAAIEAARTAGVNDNSPEMLTWVRSELNPRYASWRFFDEFLEANIEGMIRWRRAP